MVSARDFARLSLRPLARPLRADPVVDGDGSEDVDARRWLASTLFETDPRRIAWRIHPRLHAYASRELPSAMVVAGAWDRCLIAYEPHPAVRCHLDAVVNRRPSRAGPEFADLGLDRARARRYRTMEDRERRSLSIEALLHSVEQHGILPQNRGGPRSEDEIGVYLTRDGRLVWGRQGDHRLSLAQLLDVPRVPIIVRAIHAGLWHRVTRGTRPGVDGLKEALAARGVRPLA